jgi:hypothetical protein
MAKYINPYTDFGFKKLFGEEGNKNLLIDFLNQLLPSHHQIKDLTFQNVEQVPDTSEERKAQREDYEKSRLSYIGIKQVTETAEKDGLKKGKEERNLEIAKSMKTDGLPINIISKHTGLSEEEIEKL